MPDDLEKRWVWFVGLAVERFDVWARSLKPKDVLRPLEDTLPPLDVLMVWHSYMLNPRWYAEDSQRILACKPLAELGHAFGKQLARLPSVLDSPPSEARISSFYAQVSRPFDPIDSASVTLSKEIQCPRCRVKLVVPYIKSDGTGYLQSRFRFSCSTDSCPVITKDALCARKLAENLSRQGSAPDSFLPGTFFTESRAAGQKAGKFLISDVTLRYDVAVADSNSDQIVSLQDNPVLKVLQGSSYRLSLKAPDVKVTGASTSNNSHITTAAAIGYNEALCLKILHGANYKMAEIRGQFKRNNLIGRVMSAHSTPMIYSVDLSSAVLRQGDFVQKMTHLEWTKSGFFDAPADEVVLQHAIARYHACIINRFLDLMSSSPASFFVPTLDIDLVWHTHQLMNAQYETDCKRYVGRFIDQCVAIAALPILGWYSGPLSL
ncbi:hypothetical protein MD484_g7832, partial [Candolleomyces efflorescens]